MEAAGSEHGGRKLDHTRIQFPSLYVVPYKHKLLQHVQVLSVGNRPTGVEQQHWIVYMCTTAEIQEESNLTGFEDFPQPPYCLNSLVS